MPLAMGALFVCSTQTSGMRRSCLIYPYKLGVKDLDDLLPLAKCDLGFAILSKKGKCS